jgi:hypothetical protein
VYRLFKKGLDPQEGFSRKFRNPDKHFNDKDDPCRERALSVWLSKEKCDHYGALAHNKKKVTKRLVLQRGSGVYKPFENEPQHLSWWRCGASDPVRHAQEVK